MSDFVHARICRYEEPGAKVADSDPQIWLIGSRKSEDMHTEDAQELFSCLPAGKCVLRNSSFLIRFAPLSEIIFPSESRWQLASEPRWASKGQVPKGQPPTLVTPMSRCPILGLYYRGW